MYKTFINLNSYHAFGLFYCEVYTDCNMATLEQIESMNPATNPAESYTVIDASWYYDADFYREAVDIFKRVEDPSPDAIVPTLRRRSFNLALVLAHPNANEEQIERASQQQLEARRAVSSVVGQIAHRINQLPPLISKNHPLHSAQVERIEQRALELQVTDPVAAQKIRRLIYQLDGRTDYVEIGIFRKRDSDVFAIDAGSTYPYVDIGVHSDPIVQALAYTTARAGLHFDI